MCEAGWIMQNHELITEEELEKLQASGWGVVAKMLKSNIREYKRKKKDEEKEVKMAGY